MALQIGDSIPDFKAIAADGTPFDSQSIVGKQPVVIYFYPKDDTKVCTEQACSFRDQYEDFKALGATVIGISSDSVKAHQQFTEKYRLPFLLLSDENRKLRSLFGVPNDLLGLIPGRVTYVADENGVILMVYNSMSGKIHIKKAYECLKKLA
jgi:peroxiredoxin Q/BCP